MKQWPHLRFIDIQDFLNKCRALHTWLEKERIALLFYSTILIVSLIVAVVIVWFYRTTKDTSPASTRSQKPHRPYREEMTKTSGRVYKVTRKVSPLKKTNLKTISKPWGW